MGLVIKGLEGDAQGVTPKVPIIKDDPLYFYSKDVKKVLELSSEEQFKLLEDYRRTGDLRSRDLLFESALKMVFRIASKYTNKKRMDFTDLIQEGNLGLLKAIDKYDLEYKDTTKFTSYAAWWINAYMSRYLANKGSIIREPASYRFEAIKVRRIIEHLKCKLGREPNASEIALEIDVDEDKVEKILKKRKERGIVYIASMHESIPDMEGSTFEDVLSYEEDENTDVLYERLYLEQIVKEEVEKISLSERDRHILEKRFYSVNGHTLQEVGDELGISRERVRQLELRIKDEIRERLVKNYPEYFDGQAYGNSVLSLAHKKRKGKDLTTKGKKMVAMVYDKKEGENNHDEYKWTIERGVHVELRCNVQLKPEHFDKIVEFMEIVSTREIKIKVPKKKTEVGIVKTKEKRKGQKKVYGLPSVKKKRLSPGKLPVVIKNTLLELPEEWVSSGVLAKKAVELGFWKNPPPAYQSSMSTALKRLRGKVDWLETKKKGVKTLYRYKITRTSQVPSNAGGASVLPV